MKIAAPLFLIGLALGAYLQETTFVKRITAFQIERYEGGPWLVVRNLN